MSEKCSKAGKKKANPARIEANRARRAKKEAARKLHDKTKVLKVPRGTARRKRVAERIAARTEAAVKREAERVAKKAAAAKTVLEEQPL